MKIDNEFTVGVPIERAWQLLTDLEGIAPCLPGARLTGVEGDVYTGKVKIKVGPVVSEYAGTARFVEKDDAAYRAVIDAKGRDSRGAGNASAAIRAALRPDGARTVVSVSTDLNVSGKIAQFGSGMIKEVSAKLMGQFAANLEEKLLAPADAGVSGTLAGAEQAAAPPDPAASATAVPSGSAAPAASVSGSAPAVPSGSSEPAAAADGPTAAAPAGSADPLAAPGGAAPAASPNGTAPAAVADTPGPAYHDLSADADPEPLDLMAVAGRSVYKRLIPLGTVAALVLVAVIVRRARR